MYTRKVYFDAYTHLENQIKYRDVRLEQRQSKCDRLWCRGISLARMIFRMMRVSAWVAHTKETYLDAKETYFLHASKETYFLQASCRNIMRASEMPQHHSLLHLECHFFSRTSLSLIVFARFLLPRFVAKRPMRLRLEIGIARHSKFNMGWLWSVGSIKL